MTTNPHALGPPTQQLLSDSTYNHDPARVTTSMQGMSLDSSQPRGSPPPGFSNLAGSRAPSHSPSGSPPPTSHAQSNPPEHHISATKLAPMPTANHPTNIPPRQAPPHSGPTNNGHQATPIPRRERDYQESFPPLSREQRLPSMSSPPAQAEQDGAGVPEDNRIIIPCESAEDKRRFQDILYNHRKYLEEMADCKYQIGPPDGQPGNAETLLYVTVTSSTTIAGRDYLRSMVETKDQLLEIPKMDHGGAAGTVTEGDRRGGYNRPNHNRGGYPGYKEYDLKEGEEKKTIQVPSSAVGLVIGTRGTTINMIRNQTGADVQVEDDDVNGRRDGSSGYYRNVILTGRPEQIEHANVEIDRIVRSRRSRGFPGRGGPRFNRPYHDRGPPRYAYNHYNGPPHHPREPYRVAYSQPPPGHYNRPHGPQYNGPAQGPVMTYPNSVQVHSAPVVAYPQPYSEPAPPRASPPMMVVDQYGHPIQPATTFPAPQGFAPVATFNHTPAPSLSPVNVPPVAGQDMNGTYAASTPYPGQNPAYPQPHPQHSPPMTAMAPNINAPIFSAPMPDPNAAPADPNYQDYGQPLQNVPMPEEQAYGQDYSSGVAPPAEVGYGPVVWQQPTQAPPVGDYYNSPPLQAADQQPDGMNPYATTFQPAAPEAAQVQSYTVSQVNTANTVVSDQSAINLNSPQVHEPRIHGIKPFSPQAQPFHPQNTSDG